MNIQSKIKKIIKADNKNRRLYLGRFIKKIVFYVLPFVRIFMWPFVSSENKRNVIMDFLERATTLGSTIRYRYYFDFKIFYSCLDEVGTGIINNTMCNRTYEEDTCLFLKRSLSDITSPSFIDVGANIGLISLYMLKKVPNLKIYAFEPSPHQHGLFKRTIKENGISSAIKLYNLALSDKEGQVPFFAHNTGCPADGFKDTGRGGDGKNIQVNTTRLDSWWNKQGRPKIDLIKVDTEGSELLVFMGGKEMLCKCNPDIFFEMQEINYKVYEYSYVDILSFFQSIHYSVFTESGEKISMENIEFILTNNYNFIAKSFKKIN